jgi:Aspartyl protease/PDZ domain
MYPISNGDATVGSFALSEMRCVEDRCNVGRRAVHKLNHHSTNGNRMLLSRFPNHAKAWMRTTRLALASVLVVLALGPGAFRHAQQVPSLTTSPAQSRFKNLLTIPAEVTSYGGIFLRARVNNSLPMWFVLDSGASSPFFIDTRQAKKLELKLHGRVSREGGAGPAVYEVARSSGLTISLGGFKTEDQTADVISLDSIAAQVGRPLDGLVGVDLFLRYVVEINYVGNEVTLHDPETYTYSGAGESIPLKLRNGHFFVPAKVQMPGHPRLEGQFLVDTGGVMVSAVLTTPFAQSKNLPASNQKTILDRSLSGLGGETRVLISRATSFTLGNRSIRAPLIYVSQDTGGALASSDYEGLIGSEILRRFKVVFDYPRSRLILEPNAHYAEPVEYDMSGFSLRAYGDDLRTFRVYQVLDNSPAAEAGLRVGDVLATIDDLPASRFTLEEIWQMMKQPGHEHKLSIKRGSWIGSVKITTRKLI